MINSSKILNDHEYLIENFVLNDENYKELSELITSSFLHDEAAQKEGATIIFSEETFNRIFRSPYLPDDLFVRAIHKKTGKTIGFVGCIPRTVVYQGKLYKGVVPAWAAVHYKHQRKGIGLQMSDKVRLLLIEKGFDAGFSLFEPEQRGKDMSQSLAKKSEMSPLKRLLSIKHFLIRIFDVKKVSEVIKIKKYEQWGIRLLSPPKVKYKQNPQIRKFKSEDAERLYELMEDHIKNNQMAIKRDHDDFIWYLNQPGVNCVVHENETGEIDGFLLAWHFTFAGFGKTIPFGWLDLVHLYRISQSDATDLCKFLAKTSKEMGWLGIQMPFIPYFDPKPFKKAKFIFFPKKLNLDVFTQKGVTKFPVPKNLKTLYFDWR